MQRRIRIAVVVNIDVIFVVKALPTDLNHLE